MKFIVLIALVCAAASNAEPGLLGLDLGGLGSNLANGLGGTVGTGLGLVSESALGLANGALGLANGALGLGSGLVNGLLPGVLGGLIKVLGAKRSARGVQSSGAGFNRQQYANGAGGGGQQDAYGHDGSSAHNDGSHHSKVVSITQAENSDNHNIGSSQGYNRGQHSGSGFNRYQSGAAQQGNQYGQGYHRGIY